MLGLDDAILDGDLELRVGRIFLVENQPQLLALLLMLERRCRLIAGLQQRGTYYFELRGIEQNLAQRFEQAQPMRRLTPPTDPDR